MSSLLILRSYSKIYIYENLICQLKKIHTCLMIVRWGEKEPHCLDIFLSLPRRTMEKRDAKMTWDLKSWPISEHHTLTTSDCFLKGGGRGDNVERVSAPKPGDLSSTPVARGWANRSSVENTWVHSHMKTVRGFAPHSHFYTSVKCKADLSWASAKLQWDSWWWSHCPLWIVQNKAEHYHH